MRKRVHQAINRSHDITLVLKPIAPQSLPKVASSTSSKTYVNDVDSNDFASNSKSDLRDVLASYPYPRPYMFYRRSQNVS